LLAGLDVPEGGVEAVGGDQVFVAAFLHQAARFEHVDAVGVADRGEAVRDHDHRALVPDPFEMVLGTSANDTAENASFVPVDTSSPPPDPSWIVIAPLPAGRSMSSDTPTNAHLRRKLFIERSSSKGYIQL
jgi:hypothetical protein